MIRSAALKSSTRMVDTGATLLGMPKRLIEQLGIAQIRTGRAKTTTGISTFGIFGPVRLTIQDRACSVDVSEVAEECPVLIGYVPLELLDFVVNPKGQSLDRQSRSTAANSCSTCFDLQRLPHEIWSFLSWLTVVLAVSAPARGQTVPVPDTIRAEGVPPVPAAVRQALEPVSEHPLGELSGLGRAGPGMYITTRFADVPQVHFVAEPAGARTQLTFLAERVGSVAPRPRHDQFLYTIDEGGAENNQLFLQDKAGGEPRRITDGKSRNMGPAMVAVGRPRWPGAATPATAATWTSTSPPRATRISSACSRRSPGQWTVADWSPDETRVAAVEYISINESYIHIIEVATGKTETITPRRADPKAEPVAVERPAMVEGRPVALLPHRPGERVPPAGSSSSGFRADRSRSRTTSRGTSRNSI